MKPRADSLFAKLGAEQRDELLARCVDGGASLAAGLELLRGWGVESSAQALSRFLATHGFAWRLERARAAAEATAEAPTFGVERARLLDQKAFEAVAAADCPPKVLLALRAQELAAAKVRVEERRVILLEKKMAEAKAALEGVKSKGGLTPETLRQIEEAANLL